MFSGQSLLRVRTEYGRGVTRARIHGRHTRSSSGEPGERGPKSPQRWAASLTGCLEKVLMASHIAGPLPGISVMPSVTRKHGHPPRSWASRLSDVVCACVSGVVPLALRFDAGQPLSGSSSDGKPKRALDESGSRRDLLHKGPRTMGKGSHVAECEPHTLPISKVSPEITC